MVRGKNLDLYLKECGWSKKDNIRPNDDDYTSIRVS